MASFLPPVLIAGVAVPILLHLVSGGRMSWWPDTITLGVAFGLAAALIVLKKVTDLAINRNRHGR